MVSWPSKTGLVKTYRNMNFLIDYVAQTAELNSAWYVSSNNMVNTKKILMWKMIATILFEFKECQEASIPQPLSFIIQTFNINTHFRFVKQKNDE